MSFPRMRLVRGLRRLAAAPLLAALLALPALGQDQPWRQGYVMKGEVKIEGKIQDRGDRILVKQKNGIELEFAPSEVSRPIYTEEDNPDAPAATKRRMYEVKKADGTVIKGMAEERDGAIVIRPIGKDGKEQPEITLKPGEFESANPLDEGSGGPDIDDDRWPDLEGHFVLERPSPDWKIRRSTSPTVRAQMTLTDGDKSVSVSVLARPYTAPAPNPYTDVTRDNAKKVQPEAEAEIKKEFDRLGAVNVDVGEFWGSPVYELRYDGNAFGETTSYQFLEMRFCHDGILYSVVGSGDSKYFKDYTQKVRDAFAGFSFLPAVGADDESYTDLIQGFAIDRPASGNRWRAEAHPFDSDRPLSFRNDDGRATIKVQLADANGRSAASFVDEVLKENAAKPGFERTARSTTTRSGVQVEVYRCYVFGADNKQRDVQGIAAVIGRRVLHVSGEAPTTDPDSKSLQSEIQNAIDRMRLLDPKVTQDRLGNGSTALGHLAAGIEAHKKHSWADAAASYSKAIETFPDYARAFFLRATVNEELKQWKACREDLAHAIQLDPRPEVANRAAGVFLKEAQDRAKDKQWGEACKAWKEVLRADPKNPQYRKDVVKFYQDWWNDSKQAAAKAAKDQIGLKTKEAAEEIERNRWSDREFNKTMADIFAEAGEIILRDNKKNWDRAKALANRALAYDKTNTKAQGVVKDAESIHKQLEAASNPKHK